MEIEKFADSGRHPAYTFEGKMAAAFREAVEDLEIATDDNDLYRIDEAQKRVEEIQSDIENFIGIVGGYSRHGVAEKLNRCKLDIARSKRKARNVLKRAELENPDLCSDNVEKLEVVQTAYRERDRIIAKLKPTMVDLKEKLNRAEKMLKKY
ncbi:MAG: hypothetical protein WAW52_01285 [Methanothrix sp.]